MSDIANKTKSGLFFKFAERAGAQGVNFIVSIVLARLLLPEEFGLISLVIVFIAILDVFVTYGFGNSLIAKKDSDEIDFSTCFYFGIALSLVVYALVFISAESVANFYNSPEIALLIRVMGLRIPVAAINSVQHAYVSKLMIFKKFFYSTSIGTVSSGIISVIMAYHGFGVWALAAQYLLNSLIDTVCLWIIVGWRPIWAFSFERLKQIYDYGWKILVVGLIDTGYNQLRNLVIAKKYTTEDLAFYSKGNQFPSLGMTVIEPTINGVIFPALSNCNDDKAEMKAVTRRVISISCYIFFPLMIGLMAVAKPLVIVLLTEKWLECVVYLQISCLAFLLRPIQVINNCVIKASGESGLLLKLDIIKKVIGIILLVLSIPYGVIGIALSLVLTNIISTVINVYPNRNILAYGYREQLADVSGSLVLSMLMGGVVYAINYVPVGYLTTLIIQVVIGVIVYVMLSWFSNNSSFVYLKQMVLNSIK